MLAVSLEGLVSPFEDVTSHVVEMEAFCETPVQRLEVVNELGWEERSPSIIQLR